MKKIPTFIPVVAVALLAEDGKILMQRRRLGGSYGGLWEFPGGKIEHGETAETALIREIREELGCVLISGDLFALTFSSDPSEPPTPREPYVILLYTCRKWQGELRCLDGEAIAWFAADELVNLPMPPLDIPLAQALMRSI